MGLDASVYCDCFETGRLREPPPPGWKVLVDDDGRLVCRNDDLEVLLAFDQWRFHRACQHEGGVLVQHYIGNMATVALLRNEIQRKAALFPIILNQVLYDGTHSGDFIAVGKVSALKPELLALSEFHCQESNKDVIVCEFERQMSELVDAALKVGKPISF
jgi:hypothetical protein